MAHELAKTADGRPAIFSVDKTPWHRLGIVLNSPPDTETALGLAGADFSVELRPVFADVNAGNASPHPRMVPVEGRFATVRLDRNLPLGLVSQKYTPLQNDEAFRILDPLVKDGRVFLETGGVLREGADVWIMARFALPSGSAATEYIKRERIEPYFLLANNHSGRRGVLCSLTPIRVVCANTLGLAETRARGGNDTFIKVRHTRFVEERVREAANQLMKDVVARLDEFASQQQVLQKTTLTDATWAELVLDHLARLPDRPQSRAGERTYERNLERILGRRRRLTWLWEHGPGHQATKSAWEAYQAVTHSLDHDTDHWLVRSSSERRLTSLFDGRLAEKKNSALQRLYDFALKSTRTN